MLSNIQSIIHRIVSFTVNHSFALTIHINPNTMNNWWIIQNADREFRLHERAWSLRP